MFSSPLSSFPTDSVSPPPPSTHGTRFRAKTIPAARAARPMTASQGSRTSTPRGQDQAKARARPARSEHARRHPGADRPPGPHHGLRLRQHWQSQERDRPDGKAQHLRLRPARPAHPPIPLGGSHRLEYDAPGLPITETDADGRAEYDRFQRLIRQIDGAGNITQYRYAQDGCETATRICA